VSRTSLLIIPFIQYSINKSLSKSLSINLTSNLILRNVLIQCFYIVSYTRHFLNELVFIFSTKHNIRKFPLKIYSRHIIKRNLVTVVNCLNQPYLRYKIFLILSIDKLKVSASSSIDAPVSCFSHIFWFRSS
jgi:hypothetical protein